MVWRLEDEQGAEVAKIRHRIVHYTRGKIVLDIGAGPWKAWPHMISIDNKDEWKGADWEPDLNMDCTDLSLFADNSVDAIFSSHTLEHLEDHHAVLREWWRVIKPTGYLCLYLPHKDFYPNMGQEGSNPDHKHDFRPENIINAMNQMKGGWDLVENEERNQYKEYSFFQVYQKLQGSQRAQSWKKKAADTRPKALVVRYGGVGDCMQTASIFPYLREKGYRVIFQTVAAGEEVCRYDPNIDEILVQNRDQVPQGDDLMHYWEAWQHEVDLAINLSEAVEGSLLGLPGRRQHAMNQPARHLLFNRNYHELIHAMADVPLPVRQQYYPLAEEVDWAKEYMSKRQGPIFGLCLMGTSVHKIWPYIPDLALELINRHPTAKLMTLGSGGEQYMEHAALAKLAQAICGTPIDQAWKTKMVTLIAMLKAKLGKDRFLPCAGRWDLRQQAAICMHLDGLIGPETGPMNIAAMMDTPKLCILSHSSPENLTKHWKNTWAIESSGCVQSPCHRMHYNFDHCFKDEKTAAALCAAAVSAETVADWCLRIAREKENVPAAANA